MKTGWFCVAAIAGLLTSAQSNRGDQSPSEGVRVESSRADATARIREACRADFDVPFEAERQLEAIGALGENGRQALLTLARTKTPNAACALKLLVRLEDRRAIRIIRQALREISTNLGVAEVALEGVARFRDIDSFDGVAAAFRSEQGAIRSAAV